jgi:cephalosporin hydroxylase
MKYIIDTSTGTLVTEDEGERLVLDLYSRESFELLSLQWVKIGWSLKYQYTFSWFGRPVIQLPEDMIRIQEVIYRVKPDVIVETGVAHGGSLIFYACLCKAIGRGRVIGVDVEIRPHNRRAIESHDLFPYITLIEGSSTDQQTVKEVKSLIKKGESVLVVLDSDHTKQHVVDELDAYHNMVTPGSYIVATDGIMKDLADIPRGKPDWVWNHPAAAAAEFAQMHPEFVLEQPMWLFNESSLATNVTHWPGAWLRRL